MKKFRRLMTIISFIFLCTFLSSCLEVKHSININKDGSGEARLEIAVMVAELIPRLRADILPKGWNIIEESEKTGKHVIVFGKKFKDISELSDNETSYDFSVERSGFLKKSYSLHVEQLISGDMPFPIEIIVRMPGSISETNGTKISSNEVKLYLQGFRRGTELNVKSSGFAMPDFASLKEAFNRFFNSILYREAIIFSYRYGINIMDVDGGNQKKIIADGGEASWSSDIKKIAFFSNRDGNEEIYLTDINGNNVKRLTNNSSHDRIPYWTPSLSPDGKKIAFVSTRAGDAGYSEIYVMDADGSNVRRLTNRPCRNFNPSWSPDGKKIAFASCDDMYSEKYNTAIYVMDADGGNVKMLPNNHANSRRPSWSPDGKNIVFYSDRNRGYKIYIMDENGGNVRRLTSKSVSDEYNPLWSPDGRKIAFSSYNGDNIDISVINANGGNSKIISKFPLAGDGDVDLNVWILLPRITFISPSIAKLIILIAMALTGLLFFFGMALITRKAVEAVIPKTPKGKVVSRGMYCPQCGKENLPSASFCTSCGQKLK